MFAIDDHPFSIKIITAASSNLNFVQLVGDITYFKYIALVNFKRIVLCDLVWKNRFIAYQNLTNLTNVPQSQAIDISTAFKSPTTVISNVETQSLVLPHHVQGCIFDVVMN